MADGRDQSGAFSYRAALPWTNIFRCFQVALDPRKLFVAALGILAMSFLWWLLSNIFYSKAPSPNDPDYSNSAIQRDYENKKKPDGSNYAEADFSSIAAARFKKDYEQWQVLDSLAGPGGRLRTLPWYEYRGPNPFLFFTDTLGGTAEDRLKAVTGFVSGSVPVLVEPLVKLLLPVAKIVSPGISPLTRLYLFLILLTNVAVWAFCGGIITRIAAIQLANKGPITFMQAVRFVAQRYISYLGAPLVPLGIIAVVAIGLFCYGLVALIPFLGDIVLLGIGLPAVILGGAIMAVFLVGLVGYPMMYTTLSVEGDQSDTFDALSRSVNYVYQAPWHYLWNWFVAVMYGAAVTLFVLFFMSLTVYVGKWAVGLAASLAWSDRKPEYLFVYAPESFGWRMGVARPRREGNARPGEGHPADLQVRTGEQGSLRGEQERLLVVQHVGCGHRLLLAHARVPDDAGLQLQLLLVRGDDDLPLDAQEGGRGGVGRGVRGRRTGDATGSAEDHARDWCEQPDLAPGAGVAPSAGFASSLSARSGNAPVQSAGIG
jgi:hypothetical protein